MLRRLDEGAGNVLGYEITGKLTQKEFETISGEIRAAVAEHGKVRLLVRMLEIPRMELGALVEDLKLTPYANDIERYAVVSDSTLVEAAETLGNVVISGEMKRFEGSQYEEAWRWVLS